VYGVIKSIILLKCFIYLMILWFFLMQSTEIGNLSQYLAMKEFHGHNISDEMLKSFIKAQNVIDQTREDLGKPANIIYSRANATNEELVQTSTDMYIVQHIRDKITDETGVEEVFHRASLASLYEQGNCKEFSTVAFKNAMEEFAEENVTIRRKRGLEVDHGWNEISIENKKGKKYLDETNISIDAWSEMKTPIFTEDINEDYRKSKVLATIKSNKVARLDEYYEYADNIHCKNPDPLREKDTVATRITQTYRNALQQSQNAKGEMMIGMHTPDETLVLSEEFDNKTQAKEKEVLQKLSLIKLPAVSDNEASMQRHIGLMHQVRTTGVAKRIGKPLNEAVEQANTSFSQRVAQERAIYQTQAR